ncbi:MAG: ATP-binding protein [Deltaproteobacteria bacterium]|jgi:hypothetical protein|nr:ATP-binding protein [Deltaproteobacteria bacterium]
MEFEFITPQTDSRMVVLVIGRSGIGKTSLLRTIPEGEPVFTISAEAGLLSVRDLVTSGRVQGIVARRIDDIEAALDNLEKNPEWRIRFRWIFVDSLTELSAQCLKHYQRKFPDPKDKWNMWYAYEGRFMEVVRRVRNLQGFDVILTCLDTLELDYEKRRVIMPDIQLKRLQKELLRYFDEAFYMTEAPVEGGRFRRYFVTQPYNDLPAKDRSGMLALTEPADLGEVKRKIFGGIQ